jgi:hypothetical protein
VSVRLLATKRDGTQVLVELEPPFELSASATDDKFKMFYFHDANGTDHYFNKDDGTYDGWGKAMCENGETNLHR